MEDGRKTVAFSKWDHPYEVTPEKKETLETRARDRENEPRVEGSNDSLMDDFFKQMMDGRKKWIVPEETYCKYFSIQCFVIVACSKISWNSRGKRMQSI